MKYLEFNPRPYEIHSMVLSKVKSGSKVLELGCATGYFSKKLMEKNCTVTGIDYEKKAAKIAEKFCDKVYVANLEDISSIDLKNEQYDYVLCMDVIEHIQNREQLLNGIHKWLKPTGSLILSTPNVAHISIRWKLLLGDFSYTKIGILDETHVHFFIRKTLMDFLKQRKFNIDLIEGSSDFGQIPYIGRFLRHIPKKIQYRITQTFSTLFSVQFMVLAHPV